MADSQNINTHVTLLGSGAPEGFPIILSPETTTAKQYESQLRPGLLVESGKTLLFDTSPDLREQLLHTGVKSLDGVFITHSHFDHMWGLPELSQYCFLNKQTFPIYGTSSTVKTIAEHFLWLGLEIQELDYDKKYDFGSLEVVAHRVTHSEILETAAFSITNIDSDKNILYAPDFKSFISQPSESYEKAFVDGMYYFGDYVSDNDHLHESQLQDEFDKINSKDFTLIGVSPWFYKKTKAELQGQLPSNIEIPSDMQQWDI